MTMCRCLKPSLTLHFHYLPDGALEIVFLCACGGLGPYFSRRFPDRVAMTKISRRAKYKSRPQKKAKSEPLFEYE